MSKRIAYMASTALLLSAGGAFANVTAQEIWAEWQEMQAAMGASIEAASESYEGRVLTLNNVTTSATVQQSQSQGVFSKIEMQELDDGTVRIQLSPTYAISTIDRSLGETTLTTMELRHEGLEIIASGTPSARVYEYAARQLTLELGDVVVDGETIPVDMRVVASDMTSRYTLDLLSEPMTFTTDDVLGAIEVAFKATDPTEGDFALAYQMMDVSSGFTGTLGDMADSGGNMGTFLTGGAAMLGEFAHESSRAQLQVEAPEGAFEIDATTGAGVTELEVQPARFGLRTQTVDAVMSGTIPGFPFPLEATMAQSTFGMAMPLRPSAAPEEISLTVAMRELELSDVIWGLFDPQGLIPRDPATLAIDLSGTATLTQDLTASPDELALMQGAPGELNSMRINELLLTFGGAELVGTGAATFNNNGPFPMPEGRVNLRLDGGFALLDRLAQLGVVPQEQVGMVRMFSGMFATPVGDDALASEIEFTPNGGILINGFPLQ